MSIPASSSWLALCWIGNTVPGHTTTFAISLAVHVCIQYVCILCCARYVPCSCVCSWTLHSHCVQGKAIGRPGWVIKVKLLPPRLFRLVWRDNRRGSPSLLLFHTRPAFLPALFWQLFPGFSSLIYTSGDGFLTKEWELFVLKCASLTFARLRLSQNMINTGLPAGKDYYTHQIYFRYSLLDMNIFIFSIVCANWVGLLQCQHYPSFLDVAATR